MGYHLEFNCLLRVASSDLDLHTIRPGDTYTITKDNNRLYPLNIPIEICDQAYHYYGKVAVRRLTLEAGRTILDIEVLKVFSDEEAAIYTTNFIKPSPINS